MFSLNFVNKFPKFSYCLGNFILPAFWYNMGLHEQMLFFHRTWCVNSDFWRPIIWPNVAGLSQIPGWSEAKKFDILNRSFEELFIMDKNNIFPKSCSKEWLTCLSWVLAKPSTGSRRSGSQIWGLAKLKLQKVYSRELIDVTCLC